MLAPQVVWSVNQDARHFIFIIGCDYSDLILLFFIVSELFLK